MEQSPVQWPSEGDEYPTFIFQSEMTSLDHFDAQEIIRSLGEDFEYPSSFSPFDSPRNTELNAPINCSSMEASEGPINVIQAEGAPGAVPNASSISFISFGADPEPWPRNESFYPRGSTSNEKTLDFKRPERDSMASRSTSQDHVIAERKRREKLTQQFIALSAIIPDLKKNDKASLVGGAINYLKQLEEKVKTLEEQAIKKNTEPIIFVKKSHVLSTYNDISDADGSPPDKPVQKVEASLEGETILMRIHCEKKKGILVKVLSEIEKLQLSVINTGVVPFTDSFLNITVTAQIEEGFSMTVQDLVKELNSALNQLLG